MAKTDAISGLRPLYSFDQLVIGPHNHVAVGACLQIIKSPGETYNPLFIYGPPGVGKTHLMQAVAHQILTQNPSYKVRYISAERFMSEVLTAISEDRTLSMRGDYSTIDLLIIDDVQYMTESKISQEELFHIFNNMHQANKQVILAADRPPNQLTTLNKNIRSRLEWGLATDVKIPNEATRLEILKKKQQQSEGLNMTDPMFEYVAKSLKSNVRELEGFLKRIHAYVTLSHQEISMELVKSVVDEISPDAVAENSVAESSPPPSKFTTQNGTSNGKHKLARAPEPMFDYVEPAPAPEPRLEKPVEMKAAAPMPPPAPPPPPPAPSMPSAPEQNKSFNFLIDSIDIAQPAPAPLPAKKVEAVASPPVEPPTPAPRPAPVVPVPPPAPIVEAPPPAIILVPNPVAEVPEEELDGSSAFKEVGAVFFFPEGCNDALESVHRKFQEVIKKHKLKFRLKRVHSEGYAYKGKINYSSFVDVCKVNKVPVAIVIGPPPETVLPEQDFYDLLTVTLDVQGVSLQLVNWGEIGKDYRYLNLALDIALVRSR